MNIDRTTHDVQQGTGPWLRLREGFDMTASEAASALGVGKFTTRADLMRRKFTGVQPEYDQSTLAKFRAGHDAEAHARPLAEAQIEGELFPVTMSVEVAGLQLLASLDGLTLDGSTAWETKLWNESLAADVRAGDLAEHYLIQMDMQLLVSGADRCLFTCTDGSADNYVSCWHKANPARFDALLSGLLQFKADLAAYVLPESTEPAPVGRAPDTLPALRIEVAGQVTASNLAEFKATALATIRGVNRTLSTDADFADAEKAVKWCADVESRLKAAKEHALSQTADIDALFKALDDIGAEARTVRLDLDKLVTRRKTEVKEEAVAKARKALDAHIATLNAEIAPMRLPAQPVDFAGAIKGLKSFDSMQDKLDQAVAGAKIGADAAARGIRANVATFQAQAVGVEFLFADLGQIVHKAADDFQALLHQRLAQHRIAEEARESARKKAAEVLAAQRAESERLEALAAQRRQEAAAAAQAAAQPPIHQPAAVAPLAAPPAPAPAPSPDEPATLKLGDINARLHPLRLDAAGLAELGVSPARTEGAAKLYREIDFARVLRAIAKHIDALQAVAKGGSA